MHFKKSTENDSTQNVTKSEMIELQLDKAL